LTKVSEKTNSCSHIVNKTYKEYAPASNIRNNNPINIKIKFLFLPGTESDFVFFRTLFLSCPVSACVDVENFGGGGGGGMVLGRDGANPLDDDWTNFFGAGIVDTFLTSKSAEGSVGFKNFEPCSELEGDNPNLIY
jgi:hypothetical protein